MAGTDGVAYTGIARSLHWITAFAVLTMIPAGLAMGAVGRGALQNFLFDYHRSMGAVILLLAVLRIAYRLYRPPLPLPADIPMLQQMVAHVVHWALYGVLIANSLVGWYATSAYPAKINVFWLFELPPITSPNRQLAESLFEVHEYLGYAAAALVCLHIGGVIHHQFIRRDDILSRMIRG